MSMQIKTYDQRWQEIPSRCDVVVIGGGITGAGLFNEAVRRGYRVVMVEAKDFGSGTSSHSSKMVHGGLRYLSQGQFKVTRDSLKEREYLLEALPGLVNRLVFVFPFFRRKFPPKFAMRLILWLYDFFARRKTRRAFSKQDLMFLLPHMPQTNMTGAMTFEDAVTDDARLVLRTIRQGIRRGGQAFNYTPVTGLLFDQDDGSAAEDNGASMVTGVRLAHHTSRATKDIRAQLVINATGVWADRLRGDVGQAPVLRPLRGSHLIVPRHLLPLTQTLSFLHSADGHPVYCFPWYGVTLIGTTDLDHNPERIDDVVITEDEVSYLLQGVNERFETLNLGRKDLLGAYSGLRPIIASSDIPSADDKGVGVIKKKASKESRDHGLFVDRGLLTLTGGKLTTFRAMAVEALDHMGLVERRESSDQVVAFFEDAGSGSDGNGVDDETLVHLPAECKRRLEGYYGPDLLAVVGDGSGLESVPGTQVYWGELVFALAYEQVEHLDDLLLRRTRIGLVLPHGARALMPAIEALVKERLGWDDARWHQERDGYFDIWEARYRLPEEPEDADTVTQELSDVTATGSETVEARS